VSRIKIATFSFLFFSFLSFPLLSDLFKDLLIEWCIGLRVQSNTQVSNKKIRAVNQKLIACRQIEKKENLKCREEINVMERKLDCAILSLSHTHRLALSICFCHLQQFEEVSVYNSNYSSQFQFQLIAMSLIFLKQFYTYYKYDKEGIFFH
jgi:hypothetical protein